jgi:hypothetical protein
MRAVVFRFAPLAAVTRAAGRRPAPPRESARGRGS